MPSENMTLLPNSIYILYIYNFMVFKHARVIQINTILE